MVDKTKGEIDTDLTIVLPTYCEAENIRGIVESIEELGLNLVLLIIDDSSMDGTQNIVKKLEKKYDNIVLLSRPSKMGLGTAIRDSFQFCLSQPNPPRYIITMDADRSHNPKDIPRLLNHAKKGYDLVLGSRYCKRGEIRGWTMNRKMMSKIANKITRMLIDLPINDFTTGFRCYSRKYVQKVLPKLHSQTYEIQIETIRQAKLQNCRVGEVPIIFENRKKGKSKLTLNEIIAFSKYIQKILLGQRIAR